MTVFEIARLITFFIGYAVVFFSILPLIRASHWFIRVFDYPRSQKFWLNASLLVAFLFLARFDRTHDVIFVIVLLMNQLYLLSLIWSYTPLASHQMKGNAEARGESIKILIANVFQDNPNAQLCNEAIKNFKPDIVLLVETNERWSNDVQECLEGYPHRVLQPQSNTYGMVLFSQLEIVKHEVRFLVEPDIPSITADIKTRNGKVFRLHCLHPKPPIPRESKRSTERDAEILIIGKEAKRSKGPVIVAGDLNDVAWSYTTNLFLKVSGLLDPRIGRGFYSTYHAKYRLFRWPLDHVFCSSHFYLRELKRLTSIDSDHFPIFIEVSLMPGEIAENIKEKKDSDREDHRLAEQKIEAGT
jgi:endonuclease/exonuclease/phosphatase (EEP) superfamily protein YafD